LVCPVWARVSLPKDPPRALETKFSEAVMLFYDKKYSEALELNQQVILEGENQKALELKGLILKASGQIELARRNYVYLLTKIKEAGLQPTEGLGAWFDLGVIEYQLKKYDNSFKYLSFCIQNNFNTGASHFFTGLIHYQKLAYQDSIASFHDVIKSDAESLKPIAALYLSDLYVKTQNYDKAIFYLAEARTQAQKINEATVQNLPDDVKKNTTEIEKKINENIQLYNEPQFFKNAALILSHDTNVLSVPNVGGVSDLFSGKASNKLVVKALIGKADGHFEDLQKVWSYQFSGNLNENKETETGQFVTNDFNYLWNFKPYSEMFSSLRLNINSNFQYQVNPSSNKGAFGPYNLNASVGYAKRLKYTDSRSDMLETLLKYESFLQDPAFSSFMKKTGYELSTSYSVQIENKNAFYNPGGVVLLKGRYSNGNEYRNLGAQVNLNNQFHFSEINQALLIASYSYTNYPERIGEQRTDQLTSLQWDHSYKYSSTLTWLASINLSQNNSNIKEIYAYNRNIYSLGLNYSF
jgi:hypothetical protein